MNTKKAKRELEVAAWERKNGPFLPDVMTPKKKRYTNKRKRYAPRVKDLTEQFKNMTKDEYENSLL